MTCRTKTLISYYLTYDEGTPLYFNSTSTTTWKKSITLKFYVIATLYKLKWLKFWTKKIFNEKQMVWQKFVLANLCKFDF